MKKLWASSVLLIAGTTLVAGCAIGDTTVQVPAELPLSVTPSVVTYPPATAPVDTQLTITLLSGNAMSVSTRQLHCEGDKAVDGTNFLDGDSACATVLDSGKLLFTEPKPNDEKVCTGTADQNVADVFGIIQGKHVRVSFLRNNICNVADWDKITPLIGTGAE